MKKVFCTLVIACMAVSMWAKDMPKSGFGIQIGWSQPIIRLNSPDPSMPKDSMVNTVKLNGFKVGLVYDVSYIAGFGSTIGLNYTFGINNSKWQSDNPAYNQYPKTRTVINYHQLELLVDWQYKFEIAKETYLMLYTGPTLQYGMTFSMRVDKQDEDIITGKVTTTYGDRINAYEASKIDDELDPKHRAANNELRRINITWGVGAGFQYKRYFLRGGYDFGLMNPYKHAQFVDAAGNSMDRNTRGRMDQWNIRLGVYLWYKD